MRKPLLSIQVDQVTTDKAKFSLTFSPSVITLQIKNGKSNTGLYLPNTEKLSCQNAMSKKYFIIFYCIQTGRLCVLFGRSASTLNENWLFVEGGLIYGVPARGPTRTQRFIQFHRHWFCSRLIVGNG